MNGGIYFLAVIAAVQIVFLVLLILTVGLSRTLRRRRDARGAGAPQAITHAVAQWLLDESDVGSVVAAMRTVPHDIALEQLAVTMRGRVPLDRQVVLAAALRNEIWVRRALAASTSWRWTTRLAAARLLAAVGGRDDEPQLRRLLADRHPAVQAAATSAIPRIATPEMVADVLDALPDQPAVVRFMQMATLRQTRDLLIPVLRQRLERPVAPARALRVWVRVVADTSDPVLLGLAARWHVHPDAGVRLEVARMLQSYFHKDSVPWLRRLLRDNDPGVRAVAARSLGALGANEAVPDLQRAVSDASWWVRFRAAMALALLGEDGRTALRDLRESGDRYGRDMATMVSGLAPGALMELSEG
jgi:HEAT repeat protein